jgi:hypothetical protein
MNDGKNEMDGMSGDVPRQRRMRVEPQTRELEIKAG